MSNKEKKVMKFLHIFIMDRYKIVFYLLFLTLSTNYFTMYFHTKILFMYFCIASVRENLFQQNYLRDALHKKNPEQYFENVGYVHDVFSDSRILNRTLFYRCFVLIWILFRSTNYKALEIKRILCTYQGSTRKKL